MLKYYGKDLGELSSILEKDYRKMILLAKNSSTGDEAEQKICNYANDRLESIIDKKIRNEYAFFAIGCINTVRDLFSIIEQLRTNEEPIDVLESMADNIDKLIVEKNDIINELRHERINSSYQYSKGYQWGKQQAEREANLKIREAILSSDKLEELSNILK